VRYWNRADNIHAAMGEKMLNIDLGCGGSEEFRSSTNINNYNANSRWVFIDLRISHTKKDFVNCSITNIPFRDSMFDFGICSHVLEHIPFIKLEDAMHEIKRVAKHLEVRVPRLWCNDFNQTRSEHKSFVIMSKFYVIKNRFMLNLISLLMFNRFFRYLINKLNIKLFDEYLGIVKFF